ILYREGNAGLILQLSTPQLISEYYSKRGIDLGNPFPALAPELKTATIFLLDLINHTHSALTFTPSYVALKVKDETLYPVDLTTLLPMLDDADTNQHKVIEKTVFHSPVIVYPDQVESRFLIFSKMPSRFDHFKMEFDYMFFKSKEMKCKFYFTRNKVGERPQTNK
ncbi:MAG TPA: hypothetical protein VFG11_08765, partial [Acidobacteriota bacterium]|nr:hypothetical protein [Acidobacteriota bacterium]